MITLALSVTSLKVVTRTPILKKSPIFLLPTLVSVTYIKTRKQTPFDSISRLQNFEKLLESFLKFDSIWEYTSGERSEECLDKKCAYRWQTE